MTTPIIPDFILNLFKNEIKKINMIILENMCKIYKIDIEDAKIKLKDYLNISFELDKHQQIKIINKHKELPNTERCIARLFKRKEIQVYQCSRKKTCEDFCKLHFKINDKGNLKYGTINDDIPESISKKNLIKIKKNNIISI